MEVIQRLKTEKLAQEEINNIILQYEEDPSLLKILLQYQECNKEQQENIYKNLLSAEVTFQLNPKNLNIIKAWTEKGQEIEYPELIIYELTPAEMEQVKALGELEEEQIVVKGKRTDLNKFSAELVLPSLDSEEIVKKSKTQLFFQKAVMMTVLFAVVSGIGSKAYGQTVEVKDKTTINYNLDTDFDNAKSLKQLKQLQGTVDFLTKHMELSKEKVLFESISNILQEPVDEASDFSKAKVKAKVAQLDKEAKLELEMKIGDLKDVLNRKLSTQSYITENLQSFDTQIANLEQKAQYLDTQSQQDLEQLKNNPNVPALKKLMSTNSELLEKSLQDTQKMYSHIIETPAGPGLKNINIENPTSPTYLTKK